MNDILKKELAMREEFLLDIISKKRTELSEAPEGSLQCSQSRNHVSYFHGPGKQRGEYISRNNQSLIHALAQKDYDSKVLNAASEELKLVLKLKDYYQKKSGSVEEIYSKLNTARKPLVSPVELTDEQYVLQWMSATYSKKEFSKDDKEFYTAKGLRVRSKSEIIIAETLDRLQVPYYYEMPLEVRKKEMIHPDFTVLNIKKRKTFIWEHCGMLDNEKYARKAVERINTYMKYGYFPGDQLILTCESSFSPIHSKYIERVILHYLK